MARSDRDYTHISLCHARGVMIRARPNPGGLIVSVRLLSMMRVVVQRRTGVEVSQWWER